MKKLMTTTLAFILSCNLTILASFEGRPKNQINNQNKNRPVHFLSKSKAPVHQQPVVFAFQDKAAQNNGVQQQAQPLFTPHTPNIAIIENGKKLLAEKQATKAKNDKCKSQNPRYLRYYTPGENPIVNKITVDTNSSSYNPSWNYNYSSNDHFKGRPPLHPKTPLKMNSILLNGRIFKIKEPYIAYSSKQLIQKTKPHPLGMTKSKTIAKNFNDLDSEVTQYMNPIAHLANLEPQLKIDAHAMRYYNSLLDETSPTSVAKGLSPKNSREL